MQPISLKATARAVLERNQSGNNSATNTPKPTQLIQEKSTEKPQLVARENTKIIAAVEAETTPYLDANPETGIYPKPVICYTPLGNPMQVMAKSLEHEQFLLRMNPKPKQQKTKSNALLDGLTTCGNCQNFTPHHAHGKGSGSCTRHVMPSGVCHWSETQYTCNTFTPKEQPPC